MTDEQENRQQNVPNTVRPPTSGGFKPGYDPRRWMKGRGKKSPTMKEAEKIFGELIWDILSEEIENPVTHEKVDRFRAMLRSMTTSRQSADRQAILDRILGKVTDKMELTGKDGEPLNPKVDNNGFERAISSLADALREIIPAKGNGENSKVDTSE